MKLILHVLTPCAQQGKQFEIKNPRFLVGRSPQCHLRPSNALISAMHCELIQRENKVFVRDFGSKTGTFVNDAMVTGECELRDNDQLTIGPIGFQVQLEVSQPAVTAAAKALDPSRDSGEMAALLLSADSTDPGPTVAADDTISSEITSESTALGGDLPAQPAPSREKEPTTSDAARSLWDKLMRKSRRT